MKPFLIALLVLTSISSSNATLVISEIDLANNKVEIVNTGGAAENLTGYYLCNRITGSPFYVALVAGLIDAPNSTDTDLSMNVGDVMTLNLSSTFITDASGEFGLYLNSSGYTTAANMVDYVSWGAAGTRDSVAAAKGIWVDNAFVNVSGILPGQTIQLKAFEDGGGVADYVLSSASIGMVNTIPEPSTYALAAMGCAGLIALRLRRKA